MKKKTADLIFNLRCTKEQRKIIIKELELEKSITGKSYAFIIIDALYYYRGRK